MPRVVVSPLARLDLEEIVAYVRARNKAGAARVRHDLRQSFKMLRRHPQAGESCDHFGVGMRHFPVGNYVVFYRYVKDVEIVRVIHGAQNWAVLF